MRPLILALLLLLIDSPAVFNRNMLSTSANPGAEAEHILTCEAEDGAATCCLMVKLVGAIKPLCIVIEIREDSMSLRVTMNYDGKAILKRDKPIGRFCAPLPQVPRVKLCLHSLVAEVTTKDIKGITYEGCLWLMMTRKLQFQLHCFRFVNGKSELIEQANNTAVIKYDVSNDNYSIDLSQPMDSFIKSTARVIHRGSNSIFNVGLDRTLEFVKGTAQTLKTKVENTKEKANKLGEKIQEKSDKLIVEGKRVYKVGEGVYNRSKDAYESSKKAAHTIKDTVKNVKAEGGKLLKQGRDIFKIF